LSKEDVDNMTPYELESWFDMLKKQLIAEQESMNKG